MNLHLPEVVMDGLWRKPLQNMQLKSCQKSFESNVDYTVRDADYHLEYINRKLNYIKNAITLLFAVKGLKADDHNIIVSK